MGLENAKTAASRAESAATRGDSLTISEKFLLSIKLRSMVVLLFRISMTAHGGTMMGLCIMESTTGTAAPTGTMKMAEPKEELIRRQKTNRMKITTATMGMVQDVPIVTEPVMMPLMAVSANIATVQEKILNNETISAKSVEHIVGVQKRMKRIRMLPVSIALCLVLCGCKSKSDPLPLTYTEKSTPFGHIIRTYFRGDTPVGESWGYSIDDCETDIDGDGVPELLCNCVYGGDGLRELNVYRQEGKMVMRGTVSRASLPEDFFDWGMNAMQTWYDPESGKIGVLYSVNTEQGMERREELLEYDVLTYEPWEAE